MIQAPMDDPTIMRKFSYYARLSKLLSYMKTNMSERLRLQDAARVACMEKTAFSKFFRRTVGITFHNFVQQWRVSVAVEKMLVADDSLAEIAFTVGFESVITFERAFKKLTGMTPSAFRRDLLRRGGILGQDLISKTPETMPQSQEVKSREACNLDSMPGEVRRAPHNPYDAHENRRKGGIYSWVHSCVCPLHDSDAAACCCPFSNLPVIRLCRPSDSLRLHNHSISDKLIMRFWNQQCRHLKVSGG